jgi:hypothetical protein
MTIGRVSELQDRTDAERIVAMVEAEPETDWRFPTLAERTGLDPGRVWELVLGL